MMAGEATFVVVGAYSGKVFAADLGIAGAAGWGESYGIGADALADVPAGEEVRSHEDGTGIIIRRVS